MNRMLPVTLRSNQVLQGRLKLEAPRVTRNQIPPLVIVVNLGSTERNKAQPWEKHWHKNQRAARLMQSLKLRSTKSLLQCQVRLTLGKQMCRHLLVSPGARLLAR